MKTLLPIAKMLAVVIIGIFIVKIASKTLASKFPNKATNAIDSVIQTV